MVTFQSKGFSFVEVIIALSLSSVLVLILIQYFSFSRKFTNQNPQDLPQITDLKVTERGIMSNSDTAYFDSQMAIGKRKCSLQDLNLYKNFTYPKIDLQNIGEVTSLVFLKNNILLGLNSATSSDSDIVSIDLKNWKVNSVLNTGPGIIEMQMQGHYLFIANTSVNAQFQVVDLINPNNPTFVTSLKIPGSNSSNSKRNPIVTSIATGLLNNEVARIYIGTQKSDLGEIFIVDFDGKKLNYVTSYFANSIVNDLFVDKTGIWATSPSDDELVHYNSSGTVDTTFNADGLSGNGKRIDMISDNLKFLGRTYGRNELVQVEGESRKIGGSIDDLLINMDDGGSISIIVLASIGGNSVLQFWSVNQGKIDQLENSMIMPVRANSIGCDENNIYIGTSSSTLPIIIINK